MRRQTYSLLRVGELVYAFIIIMGGSLFLGSMAGVLVAMGSLAVGGGILTQFHTPVDSPNMLLPLGSLIALGCLSCGCASGIMFGWQAFRRHMRLRGVSDKLARETRAAPKFPRNVNAKASPLMWVSAKLDTALHYLL